MQPGRMAISANMTGHSPISPPATSRTADRSLKSWSAEARPDGWACTDTHASLLPARTAVRAADQGPEGPQALHHRTAQYLPAAGAADRRGHRPGSDRCSVARIHAAQGIDPGRHGVAVRYLA